MRLEIGRKIKRRCHISAVRATREILPFLEIIFKNNADMAVGLAKWLDLEPEMIEYVVGTKKKAEAITQLLS